MTKEFIDDCIARALRHDSGLDAGVLEVPGFSTGVMRRLWNNLAAGATSYLEVGAYFGGTACAAINNNPDLNVHIFEDGSQEFHGRPIIDELKVNLAKYGSRYAFSFEDFFASGPKIYTGPPFDFFFYDGNHAREFQAKALAHALPALADRFIFAVDDYCWHDVALGTAQGFHALTGKVGIVDTWNLLGEVCHDDPIWHNGVALFLCEKI